MAMVSTKSLAAREADVEGVDVATANSADVVEAEVVSSAGKASFAGDAGAVGEESTAGSIEGSTEESSVDADVDLVDPVGMARDMHKLTLRRSSRGGVCGRSLCWWSEIELLLRSRYLSAF